MTSIPDDWREFLNALISANVKFLLIGGHALAYHAEPRFTHDLDIFIDTSPENAASVVRALEAFGFGGMVEQDALLAPNKVFMLGASRGVLTCSRESMV